MLQIKFDHDWPTCLRVIQVRKCKIFVIQGQVTQSEYSDPALNQTRPSFYTCPG